MSTFEIPDLPTIDKVRVAHIPGFSGYAATSDGRILSCRQPGWVCPRCGPTFTKWRELKPCSDFGYKRVRLPFGKGRYVTKLVHQLVLLAFVGPCPRNYECCHSNGKRDDNRLENLRYDTVSGNSLDRVRHGTSAGGRNSSAKITENDAKEIRRLFAEGMTSRELAKRFKITPSTAYSIASIHSWSRNATPEERARYHLAKNPMRGSRHPMTTLSDDDVKTIREQYAAGNTQNELAKIFKVTQSSIGKIIRGEVWTHIDIVPSLPHNSDFIAQDVIKMRQEYANGAKIRELATRYKSNYATIYAIVKRVNWKHV